MPTTARLWNKLNLANLDARKAVRQKEWPHLCGEWSRRLAYHCSRAVGARLERYAKRPSPGVPAAIVSGILESVLAVAGLVYWYSHSVTTWAGEALDSALNNGPTADYDPHILGLAAFAIWCLHPLSWVLATLFVEGLARIVAAISIEQILPMWILAFADWCYGKFTHRAPEGDALHIPKGREQLRSFLEAVTRAATTVRVQELPDKLVPSGEGAHLMLEIRSSRAKAAWTPPRVVCIDAAYYRLECAVKGEHPRPFVYRLRRLAAGVPGRNVILYRSPDDCDPRDMRSPV